MTRNSNGQTVLTRIGFGAALALALFIVALEFVGDGNARAPWDVSGDGSSFNLSNWKLTLPVADDDGDAEEITDLLGYSHPDWFYAGPDGEMIFAAPVDGVTTSGSRYPRSELREMRDNDEIQWDLEEGGSLSATLAVNSVPTRDDDKPGRIIIGQIHGEDDELVRLYYQDETLYFANEHAGDDDEELDFKLENAQGDTPNVALGERFSYLIDVRGMQLTVEVHADGDVYRSVSDIHEYWFDDTFYFKAGIYLGVNDDSGHGVGQVTFYALDVSHIPGGGRGGLL